MVRAGWWMMLVACRAPAGDSGTAPGAPLAGLSAGDLARFQAGKALFQHAFTPAEGLGPLFNEERCSSCHDLPAIGGTGVETELRATRYVPPAPCDLLAAQGGDVFQDRATPALRARGVEHETAPPGATGRTRLDPPELLGLGLVAAIPESAIRAREDPQDGDRDGISGRFGAGRFGMKEDHPTLENFIASALKNELGLTSEQYPHDEGPNGAPIPRGVDPAPDPEISADRLALLAAFVRFLAPPSPARPPTAAGQDSVRRGRAAFQTVGCATCHVPEMETGPSDVPALDRTPVPLYSDLLLHDLGAELGDVCSPEAGPSEFRTARLMGLRYRTRYLHDGRAATLEDAIRLHGGEAAATRDRFTRLGNAEKAYLIRFLNSL